MKLAGFLHICIGREGWPVYQFETDEKRICCSHGRTVPAIVDYELPKPDHRKGHERKLAEFDWSKRALGLLRLLENDGVTTVGDLAQMSEAWVRRYKGYGRETVREFRDLLALFDLKFGEPIHKYE